MIKQSEDIFWKIYGLHVFYDRNHHCLLYNDKFVENHCQQRERKKKTVI